MDILRAVKEPLRLGTSQAARYQPLLEVLLPVPQSAACIQLQMVVSAAVLPEP